MLLTCNSGDRCILLPSSLSLHLFEASLHRSSCYMPQMLMSDIMPALTLSAGCKCYHRSLHRHNAPIYFQLARGGNITAHERKMPCHLLDYTSPAAHTLKKILDLFGRHSVRMVEDFPASSPSVLHQRSLVHVQYDNILIKRDTCRLLHKSLSHTFSCLV